MNGKFSIYSIFRSFDGEVNAFGGIGEPSVFVRFAGCPLRCEWCDTPYALERSSATMHLTPDEVIELVKEFGPRKLTLTGGEPLWRDRGLLETFFDLIKSAGMVASVETGGAMDLWSYRDTDVIRFVIDFKLPSSGEMDSMRYWSPHISTCDVFKFVAADQADLDQAQEVIESGLQYGLGAHQFAIGAVSGRLSQADLIKWLRGLPKAMSDVRLTFQAHKEFGWSEAQ